MENDCSCGGEISLGPWGYHREGEEFSFKPDRGIKHIIIRHKGVIDSVIFGGAVDGDYSAKIGGDGGNRTVKIILDFPSEFLTGISGTYGTYMWALSEIVISLKFHTNLTVYGPYGDECGSKFSSSIDKGSVITGFHGRSGQFLKSIGVFVKPVGCITTEVAKIKKQHSVIDRSLSPPRSARAWGGDGGREWDDGVFSTVKGVHVRVGGDTAVVTGVGFIYEKRDGSEFVSPFHGGGDCYDGDEQRTILFGDGGEGELLIGIEGFVGGLDGVEGVNVVRSLTFVTNKAKYGPVGSEIGIYFTTGDYNRKVVGFNGRCGAYLDALGLHNEYF